MSKRAELATDLLEYKLELERIGTGKLSSSYLQKLTSKISDWENCRVQLQAILLEGGFWARECEEDTGKS